LSFDTSWQELKDHFKQVAEVEHADVMEHPDGRKKGFGTVRFFNPTDAEKAINELNGKELHGRSLEVRLDSKA
jgi:RNA recognition motif-containing protein